MSLNPVASMVPSHPEPDSAFIKRLEDEAGISNALLLSDEERLRGQILLSRAHVLQKSPDSEAAWTRESQTTLFLTEYISRLSIVLASHKRLPPEILGQIFRSFFDNGRNYETRIPPLVCEIPWTLGQVCRSWRHLSRSMPELWGTTDIAFGAPMYWDLRAKDIEVQTRRMACALEILPEVSRICLRVALSEHLPPIPTRNLTSYLGHIHELHWYIVATPGQESMEILLPGALFRIQSLSIGLGQPSSDVGLRPTSYADLFGKSSCLTDLTLSSDTPNFLLVDIPWYQIRSFSLIIQDTYMNNYTRPTWIRLRDLNPFRSMSSLEEFAFEMTGEYLKMALSFGFPWDRLKSLNVYWPRYSKLPIQDNDIAVIMPTLEKCTSLTHLTLGDYLSPLPPYSAFSADYHPFILPKLRSLNLGGFVPHLAMLSLCSPGNTIRSLRLVAMPAQVVYNILKTCYHLEDLRCCIETSSQTDEITLPHLTSLEIEIWDSLAFPDLVTPSLTSLVVRRDLPGLHTIIDFVIRSKVKLEKFAYRCKILERVVNPPAQVIMDLMSILKDSTMVYIPHITLPDNLVDDFTSRSILPHVEDLKIGTLSPDKFCLMMQRRLEHEASLGKSKLRTTKGYLPSEVYRTLGEVECRLRALSNIYHVECIFAETTLWQNGPNEWHGV